MTGGERVEPFAELAAVAEVVTLCGSTKFKDAFHAENQRLTMEGCVVISLGVFGHTDLPDYDWTTDASDLKRRLDGLHFQKIRMADRVHVIDPGGYIGESTAREIAYAESLGKHVTYLSRGGGRAADQSEPHRVSSAPSGESESRERLDPLAATAPRHRLIGPTCTCGEWSAQCGEDVPGQWAAHVRLSPASEGGGDR